MSENDSEINHQNIDSESDNTKEIAPINAITYNGAKPVFMDADRYFNIDVEKTIEFIHKETIYKNSFLFSNISYINPQYTFKNII